MSNMGYCRFENTLNDLNDCYDHLDDNEENLSSQELVAKIRLIELCRTISEEEE